MPATTFAVRRIANGFVVTILDDTETFCTDATDVAELIARTLDTPAAATAPDRFRPWVPAPLT